jgi:hypothetical protein
MLALDRPRRSDGVERKRVFHSYAGKNGLFGARSTEAVPVLGICSARSDRVNSRHASFSRTR